MTDQMDMEPRMGHSKGNVEAGLGTVSEVTDHWLLTIYRVISGELLEVARVLLWPQEHETGLD